MLYYICTVRLHCNSDDIKLILVRSCIALHERVGGFYHTAYFLIIDGIQGLLDTRSTGLDLDEYHTYAFYGYDVNFLMSYMGILVKHGIALTHKVFAGNILAPLSEFVMPGHSEPPLTTVACEQGLFLGNKRYCLAARWSHTYFHNVARCDLAGGNLQLFRVVDVDIVAVHGSHIYNSVFQERQRHFK